MEPGVPKGLGASIESPGEGYLLWGTHREKMKDWPPSDSTQFSPRIQAEGAQVTEAQTVSFSLAGLDPFGTPQLVVWRLDLAFVEGKGKPPRNTQPHHPLGS